MYLIHYEVSNYKCEFFSDVGRTTTDFLLPSLDGFTVSQQSGLLMAGKNFNWLKADAWSSTSRTTNRATTSATRIPNERVAPRTPRSWRSFGANTGVTWPWGRTWRRRRWSKSWNSFEIESQTKERSLGDNFTKTILWLLFEKSLSDLRFFYDETA